MCVSQAVGTPSCVLLSSHVAGRTYSGLMVSGDPTARKWLSADDAVKQKQQIVALYLQGGSVREIAAAAATSRMSVHRVIKTYEAAVNRPDVDDPDYDEDLDAEAGALVAKLTPSLSCEDITSRAQFDLLDDLEKFRWSHLPADHPARAV
ncbi:Mycobacterium numidiamassiliense ORFan [Mycobacterium numidiamassiliense]|uniref:Mycobacterium numidiamassiliense ORFan n=2 Tax=Mycobacterium numidiamassiliense TaxID=1841861 RepID=A0A2U3PIM3_9MYCO|nr:Mycobacterium numidiamassiliense ORFan [Mycobacterium numidiamassiliense]